MSQKTVTRDEVAHIAHLAKLNIEGGELEKLTEDFNQILGYVAQIASVNTDNVQSLTHVLDLKNVMREDVPEQSLNIEDIKKMAPEFNAGYFVVPRIIDAG
ncbi:MAG: Asp-tRNA(Asn)/Glu-tRNA(Gln) amidotransferase subunit GatC [Spirochaetia bacterium]|nr:Asp-tRNA(Asn)/Glu-tRNA(Gln) amidotransferase subunit GatC [Spirochaetia bacterium]